jgi:hypothetical protein
MPLSLAYWPAKTRSMPLSPATSYQMPVYKD